MFSEFLSLLQLRGLTRSSLEVTSWWRSSCYVGRSGVTSLTSQKAAKHSWLTGQKPECRLMVLHSVLISFFCTLCPNKDKCFNPWISMLRVFVFNLWGFFGTGLHCFSQFWDDLCNCFTTLVIIRPLLSPNSRSQLLSSPCLGGWSTDSCTLQCAWVFTHAHCAAAKTRDGEKKQWEGWPQWRGGCVYLYTKWCMCRPRTTQLDPVSVNTNTPPSDTHSRTQQRRKLTHAWHFFFRFTPLPLCSLCCLKIYCIPPAEHFLNYRFEVP